MNRSEFFYEMTGWFVFFMLLFLIWSVCAPIVMDAKMEKEKEALVVDKQNNVL